MVVCKSAQGMWCYYNMTDCTNLGTHVVTFSFKPVSVNPKTASCTQFYLHNWMSSIGSPLAYELHLFGWFYASQKVTEIRRNVFPVVHAISPGNAMKSGAGCLVHGKNCLMLWCRLSGAGKNCLIISLFIGILQLLTGSGMWAYTSPNNVWIYSWEDIYGTCTTFFWCSLTWKRRLR